MSYGFLWLSGQQHPVPFFHGISFKSPPISQEIKLFNYKETKEVHADLISSFLNTSANYESDCP